MANEPEAKFTLSAKDQNVASTMRQAAASVKAGVDQIKGHFDSLTSIVGKMNTAFLAVGAALAGGKIFADAINETVNLTKESMALGKQFGISATQASVLKVALGDTFVSSDALSAAGNRITMTLRQNEKAFTDLGVKTRDANGQFRGTFEIMQDVNKRLLEFREGTDRNVEGQKIYGRAWAEVAPTLKLTAEAMQNAAEKADRLGLIVGQESVEATQKYRHSLNEVGDVFTAMKKAIGDALLPLLTELGNWFAEIGPQAIAVLKGAIVAVSLAFNAFKLAVETSVNFIIALVQTLAIRAISMADTIAHALRGDFSGAKQAWKNGTDQIEQIQKEFVDNTKKNYREAVEAVTDTATRMFTKETPVAKKSGGEASEGGTPKTAKKDDRFQEMQNALEKIKQAEGRFRQEDLTEDLQYWQKKLAAVRGSTEQDKLLRFKIEHEIFDIKKQMAAQALALEQENIAQRRAIAEQELEDRRNAIHAKFELGQISQQQEIVSLRQLEQEKFQIERKALQDRLKLVQEDKIARAKIQNDLVLLDKQAQSAIMRSQQQEAIQNMKFWQSIMQPIARTISQSITGLVQGTMKLKTALANIGQSILQEFIQQQEQKLATYLAIETTHTTAAVTGAEIRAVAEETSAKRGLLATIASALKTIAINAVKVISGVWAAISSIPIVGPFLAPVLAIAAGAAVYGLASRISSARKGYDIPAGVNPITQLHEQEMVLPQAEANAVRKMANGGSAGGRRGDVNVNFNLTGIDGQSIRNMLYKESRTIAAIITKQSRMLNRGT